MIDLATYVKNARFTHPDAFAGCDHLVKLASLAVLLLIGWLDYATGYEFGFFIFYFIPVAISAWYCGRLAGIEIAVGSAFVWYMSDKYTHHPYSHSYFIYWEMFMRLLSFLTTAMTLARIREMVLNEERLLKELLETRQELENVRNTLPPS
jgi:K+-sensing histidine kinase KdpD